jgi:hypothetical protein
MDAEMADLIWDLGRCHGISEDAVGAAYENTALDTLRICGVSLADAEATLSQSLKRARDKHPRMLPVQHRALAAQWVVRDVLRGLTAPSEAA